MNLSFIQDRVRSILKGLDEKPEKKAEKKPAPVPEPPADPDGLDPDPRVGDASPTKEDLDEATEDESDGASEGDGDTGDASGEPAEDDDEGSSIVDGEKSGDNDGDEEGEGESDEDGDERPIKKASGEFDAFGNRDLSLDELRQIAKSYGEGPSKAITTPEEIKGEGKESGQDLEGILKSIVDILAKQAAAFEDQGAVLTALNAEVSRLKGGMKANERRISKALDILGNPTTAPAKAPKAIAKSLGSGDVMTAPTGSASSAALADELFTKLRSGQMTLAQAQEACRTARTVG